MKAVVTKKCSNEDWKTAIAHKQPSLEEGDEVEYKGDMNNFYGSFIEVTHATKGFYYLKNDCIKLLGEDKCV